MIIVEWLKLMRHPEISDADDLTTWAYNRGQKIIDQNGLLDEFGIRDDDSVDPELLKKCFAEKSLRLHAHLLSVNSRRKESLEAELRATNIKLEISSLMDSRYTSVEDRMHARSIIAAANLFFFYLTQAPNGLYDDLNLSPLPEHMEAWRQNWHGNIQP